MAVGLGMRSADAAPRQAALANTLGLPCRAREVVSVTAETTVADLCARAGSRHRLVLPLGAGSNVVLPPVLETLVLRAADDRIDILDEGGAFTVLRVGAAHGWHELVLWSVARGLSGLENLALIPGTVGAAPVQNIGAYGREIAEFVVAVHGVELPGGQLRTLGVDECRFAYRDSLFKEELRNRFLITAVDLRLARGADPVIRYPALAARMEEGAYPATAHGVCEAVIALRRERLPDPATTPNVGSFFKNPLLPAGQASRLAARYPELPVHEHAEGLVKASAAWLIDRAGLRGRQLGGMRVSGRHALVIENAGGGRYDDVCALARLVRAEVRDRFGVDLEPEPQILDADGEPVVLA
ncbi:MAG: UDP-N-acetylmuramate dehydrogenase [Halieaceae bacterium]|jgi:UDP-N-acetylmuramate dehydrogenase|nr:UDP-N-acetylmuramate dehydrogenase [Halieaceae bacterium]